MLERCRATVFGLRNRSAAISRLLLPEATSLITSTSRAVRPPGGVRLLARLGDAEPVEAGLGRGPLAVGGVGVAEPA